MDGQCKFEDQINVTETVNAMMTLGSEWTAYHLTPSGWVLGDKQREFAPLLSRPAPDDRLLSVVNKVSPREFGTNELVQREVWRAGDEVLIAKMLGRFGTAPLKL